MSYIFKSEFLNKYFKQALDKEDFTLEDLKAAEHLSIINENIDKFVKINSEDLKALCSVGCKDFYFEGIDFNDVEFDETTLTNLEFSTCKLSTCNFDKLQVEESLGLFDVELKDNGLSQFSHMSQMKQLRLEGNIKDISGIKNLQQLARIQTVGVSNVPSYLPSTENLEEIVINDEEIKDIQFLRNYPNLKQITLLKSQIDITQLDILCELKRKGIEVKFNETKLKEQLEQKEYKFGEEESRKIKAVFHMSNDSPLNDYELFNFNQRYKKEKFEVTDIETFNGLIQSGLLSEGSIINKLGYMQGMDFVLESLEDISSDAIDYISKNKDKQFRFVIRTLNGINHTLLEKLSENQKNLEFYVQGDLSHFENSKHVSIYECKNIDFTDLDKLVPYRIADIKEFISVLEPIKEQTLEIESDIEKFSIIRKIALMSSEYDYSGVIDSEQFKKGREIDTRSLKGMLLEGKAVCAGNALGFSIISEYVGINAKYIVGHSVSDNGGHGWNQVRIQNEEGNIDWYNYDFTNDPDRVNDNSRNILENDETFYTSYTPAMDEKVEKCPKSISNEVIRFANLKTALKENTFEQIIEEGQYSGKKVTKQDIKNILNSLTLSEIDYITNIFRQAKEQIEIRKEDHALG